jgi:hypothetical protein
VPFLMRYVESNGWNDVMNHVARHKRLREKWSQEGVRFLRFFGQKPTEFRNYLFLVYFEKFMIAALVLLLPFFLCFFYLLLGLPGALVVLFFSLSLAVGWKTTKYFINRKFS